MKRSTMKTFVVISLILIILAFPAQVLAQDDSQPDLSISTTYPSQVAELGKSINLNINVKASGVSQIVEMEMAQMPEGWKATFRGGGQIINSVFVEANSSASVNLRLDPPENAKPGKHTFVVLAQSKTQNAKLPITISVQEQVPASLSLEADLPTIKGSPTTTFRYTTTLKNEGDQELVINLSADTPSGFLAKFQVSGQDVTSFPLGANQSKTIIVQLDPLADISAGTYSFTMYASGGDLQASIELTAEVVGQQDLSLTGLDGLLSGKANAGKETTLPLVVQNTGTAPAQGVEMSASAPSGWTVSFEPEVIAEIPAGEQVDVTARLTPAEKAVAGDYMVTMHARPAEGAKESAEFRITVTTSTLWGVAGIALIAIAVGVVALAVTRFGRR